MDLTPIYLNKHNISQLLRNECRCKKPPPSPCGLQVFKLIIIFTSCFKMGIAHGGEHSQNVGLDSVFISSKAL